MLQLGRALEVARTAHPALHVDPVAFHRFLSRRRPPLDQEGVPVHVADLYLVAAALEGAGAALELLDARLRGLLPRALRRLRVDDELRGEVLQRTRERLLVGARVPKLAEYLGRGGLDPWLRTVLVRVALNLLEARPQGEEELRAFAELAAPGPDPEVSLLGRSEQATVQAALVEALAGLEPRTRHFLALYVLEGLTLEEIGRRSGTHKSTVSRALSAARARVMATLRRRFRAGPEGDLESLLAVLGEAGADLPHVLRELLAGGGGS
ncbi:MAG TPA: sigma-70 family RNA polymerase sigma factor [Myxococcaceae bacterium]|nr:sigma-70 family RNA polymerase sigma factor [Myxococcaceae bacterium]